LAGKVSKYGKEINGDAYEGKRTLMRIHLLANSDAIERRRVEAFLSKPRAERLPREVTWLTALMRERGSIDHARAAAKDFAEAARKELEVAYREARPGPDLDLIRDLVGTVAARDA
jgi:geranylgeranyl diphosphate synthase, type II